MNYVRFASIFILSLLVAVSIESFLIIDRSWTIKGKEEAIDAKSRDVMELRADVAALQDDILKARGEYNELRLEHERLLREVGGYAGSLRRLKRWREGVVSYSELKEWLRGDKTEYEPANWSVEVAAKLIGKGEENGWDMAYVNLEFKTSSGELRAYGLCAIELSDRGEVWIIPWRDEAIDPLQVGDELPPIIHGGEFPGAVICDVTIIY